jgi:hypothetical protein
MIRCIEYILDSNTLPSSLKYYPFYFSFSNFPVAQIDSAYFTALPSQARVRISQRQVGICALVPEILLIPVHELPHSHQLLGPARVRIVSPCPRPRC